MKKNSATNRKEKALITKNKIYESAEQLFHQHGFENVNIDDIVKHAGVAKGSFYVHYESKDVLISLLINDYVNKVDTDYKTYLDSMALNTKADEIILSLAGKIADVITNDIGHENMRLLYKTQLAKDAGTKATMNYNRELYKMFYDILQKGIEQKAFRAEISAEATARQFMLIYRGLTYEWCIRYPEFDLKVQAIKLFDLVLTGVRV